MNALGMYTNPEQLCHADAFSDLTATGLFPLASGFNHSCSPNVLRASIGPYLIFRTLCPVAAGEELTISYIETEFLHEPTAIRHAELARDFVCACSKCSKESLHEDAPIADWGVQDRASLCVLPPRARLEAKKDLTLS